MTKITIAAPDMRKTVIVDETKTPKEILAEAGVNISRATIMLDGTILSIAQLNMSVGDIGAVGDCTIAVSVKLDNAG